VNDQTTLEGNTEQRYTERGTLLIDPNALTVYVNVPCPLKVRFKAEFEPFIERFNASQPTPIYCPTLIESACKGIEDTVMEAQTEAQLPDIWITMHFQAPFTHGFRERFLDTGIYQPVNNPADLAAMPDSLRQACEQHHLGFLALSFWSFICDEQLIGPEDYPGSWMALTDPKYRDMLGATGHDGKIGGISILFHLLSQGGEQAIADYAKNMRQISHFSQIIKAFGNRSRERAAMCAMPNVAARQIPSTKKVAQLQFPEGQVAVPLMFYVKASKRQACQPLIDFLHSPAVSNILRQGDIFPPAALDWSQNYVLPNWELLAGEDFQQLHDRVMDIFTANLDPSIEF